LVLRDITQLKLVEQARREFVANVSHEMKTPVTILKGFAQALEEDYETMDEPQRRKFIGKVSNSARRLESLIESLLVLSRLEGDPDFMQLEPHTLNAFLAELLEEKTERFAQAGIALSFETHLAHDSVNIDPMRLSMVMRNLLDNALKHAKGARGRGEQRAARRAHRARERGRRRLRHTAG